MIFVRFVQLVIYFLEMMQLTIRMAHTFKIPVTSQLKWTPLSRPFRDKETPVVLKIPLFSSDTRQNNFCDRNYGIIIKF